MALRATMILIVPSALKLLDGSAGTPAFKAELVLFGPVATVKNTCPVALVCIRAAKSVPLGAGFGDLNKMGQVVFGGGL